MLEYAGALTAREEMGIVAAGPLAGLLFAALCFLTDVPFLLYTGAVALLAALFNLLPAMPMDGGRLARYALETVMTPRAAGIAL